MQTVYIMNIAQQRHVFVFELAKIVTLQKFATYDVLHELIRTLHTTDCGHT